MHRTRRARIAGITMVALGAAIPVVVVALTAGTSLPYQDPTAAMLQQQAQDIARADRMLAAGAVVGSILILVGVALLVGVAVRGQRHMEDSDGDRRAQSNGRRVSRDP
jgi:Ca2+/Na+ antiporter